MKYIILTLIMLVVLNIVYFQFKRPDAPDAPKPKLRKSREDCYVWWDNDRKKTRANNALEYLLATNKSHYCHSGPPDAYFGIVHQYCSACKESRSFWDALRNAPRPPFQHGRIGKTVCVGEYALLHRYRCNVKRTHSLTDDDYDECRRARHVVYDKSSEEGYLCAKISNAVVTAIGTYGRYH